MYRHFENKNNDFSENWELIYLKMQLFHSWHIPKELSHGYLFNYVHSSFLHKKTYLETTKMYIFLTGY